MLRLSKEMLHRAAIRGIINSMKTPRYSVPVKGEDAELLSSISESEDRSHAYILEKAVRNGLPTLDTPAAKAIREKKAAASKSKKKNS